VYQLPQRRSSHDPAVPRARSGAAAQVAPRPAPASGAEGPAIDVAQRPLDDILARAVLAREPDVDPSPLSRTEVLQRTYNRQEGADWYQKTDEDAEYTELLDFVNSEGSVADIKDAFAARSTKVMKATIERMMSDALRGDPLAVIAEAFGRRQPNREWYFKDKEQAARAVLGESYRDESEAKERELADEVMSSARILAGIRSYMAKVETHLTNLRASGDVDATFFAKKGIYSYYYQPGILSIIFAKPTTVEDVVRDRASQGIRPLIAAIKDITTAFYDRSDKSQALWDSVVTPPDKQYGGSPNSGNTAIDQEKIDDIRPDGVLDESTASVKYARRHKMLIDVGPSFTTGRAMQLGTAIGADDFELMAVALGFFAFWNKEYWRGTSGIHHFHYVMDMLDNYAPGSYPYEGYPDSIAAILP
jgi:hypothetical protein